MDSDQINPPGKQPVQHKLAVYVSEHCANCGYAQEVAARIRTRYPNVAVQVIDIGKVLEPVPDSVFATPTYLLDGRVWSLGNPSDDMIVDAFG